MSLILLKIFLAPALIGLVSLAGRKWGPGISGWLLGFPLNSAPILFFLLLEQGHRFAANAALGALLGIIAWAGFSLVYAWSCLRVSWWWSTVAGWTAYSLVGWLLGSISIAVMWAYILVCVILAIIVLLFPRIASDSQAPSLSRSELWLRMITATAIILTLTGMARFLGPTASGILSAFPAYTTILAVFNHRQSAQAAVKVLKGLSAGLYTAATFFLVLSLSLLRRGAVAAFALAVLAAMLVQVASLVFVRKMA